MIRLLVYALALCLLVSCGGSTKDTTSTSETDSLSFVEVHGEVGVLPHLEYRVAEGYFAASDTLPSVIVNQGELEQYLGMATTMSSWPTEIDWTSEFIIPIAKPETYRDASIDPVSLELKGGQLGYPIDMSSQKRSDHIAYVPFVH